MNKGRREELNEVIDHLEEAGDRLQEIIDDEQESFDNLPDGLQYSRTGASMEEAVSTLEGFHGDIDAVAQKIRSYINPKKKRKM